jgi:zinc transport system permease protein
MDTVLPFEFLSDTFMKNAFLDVILSAVVFGMIGTMAVDNKMAFFSDALGHSAMTGIALGVIFGLRNELISIVAFGVIMALLISKVKSAQTASSDTIISVFSSAALALGLFILSQYRGFASYSAYLIGDILSITAEEIITLFFVAIAVLAAWAMMYNSLLLVSTNKSLAASRGVRVILYENLFADLIAVVVMVSIKWVGILLINSMLILPAAAARNVSRSSRQYHGLSVGFSLIAGISGLITAWYTGAAAGPSIILVSAGIYFFCYIARIRS